MSRTTLLVAAFAVATIAFWGKVLIAPTSISADAARQPQATILMPTTLQLHGAAAASLPQVDAPLH